MITNETIKNLRELMRMKEEIEAEIEATQDLIKAEMKATDTYTLTGTDWKCTWNEVTTNRIDTKALKAALPEIAAQYTKATTNRRFCLA
jgi:predicted phage-related endonuclease